MRQRILASLLIGFALFTTNCVCAAETVVPKIDLDPTKKTLSTDALQAYWTFSGMVTNESGDIYNYYFQMQRKENQFHAVATLIDSRSKAVLLYEEGEARIDYLVDSKWHVGRTFMQFNPINNSWVFGVTTKRRRGFNFKVDMLGQAMTMPFSQGLRSGVELLVNQTGRLNGHIQTGEKGGKDQFVTAAKAWFKQIWVSKSQDSIHPLTGVLCQFNDGSGFFSVNLQEADALKGAVTGWRDVQGTVIPMSQFVSVQEKQDGLWSIGVSSPKIQLAVVDALPRKNEKNQVVAGITLGGMPGFCTITKDEVGENSSPLKAEESKA